MKVLHIEAGRHLYGGAQQVVYLITELAGMGVDSVLVCPDGAAVGEALSSLCPVHRIRFTGDLDLGAVRRLQRIIRTEQPDIVHLHSRRGADTLGAIAARLCGVPCVVSRRVDNPEPRWLVPLKYGLYDRVIAISHGIERVLLSCGVSAEKIDSVRSAVDVQSYDRAPERERFLQAFGLPGDARVLGVIAQLIPRKGHRHLFSALPDVLHRYPDVHVLLFGQGELRDALAREAAALSPRVRLMGFHDDLPSVLPNLYGVVHPAEREGLGVSLIQAAAAGVPIVASDVGGIPEIVIHKVNGLLTPPGDVGALSKALDRLLADSNQARAWGEAGRAMVRESFAAHVMAAGNLAVYTRLLAEKASQ